MGRSVADVAILLTAMAGTDPVDKATAQADAHKTDYLAAIAHATLRGKRIGILHVDASPPTDENAVFARAIAALRKSGAVIVPVKFSPPDPKPSGDAELLELETELKVDLNAYLSSTPPAVKTRTLADVIAFDKASARENALLGQDIFIAAEKTKGLSDPAYLKARAMLMKIARTDGLDKILNGLDALVMPTDEPSWRIDLVKGDNDSSNTSFLPAVAGYPHLTVPMGTVRGLPVGISFIGRAWSEATLLVLGAGFESATHARRAPTWLPSLENSAAANTAFAPAAGGIIR
jgi:amidase